MSDQSLLKHRFCDYSIFFRSCGSAVWEVQAETNSANFSDSWSQLQANFQTYSRWPFHWPSFWIGDQLMSDFDPIYCLPGHIVDSHGCIHHILLLWCRLRILRNTVNRDSRYKLMGTPSAGCSPFLAQILSGFLGSKSPFANSHCTPAQSKESSSELVRTNLRLLLNLRCAGLWMCYAGLEQVARPVVQRLLHAW